MRNCAMTTARKLTYLSICFGVVTNCIMFSAKLSHAQDFRDRERDASGFGIGATDDRQSGRYLPPGNRPSNPYQLGVTVRNTQTGVVINSVQPGSAAQQAGIETGDTVVSVAGYQVGYVEGRLYDLGDEIARRVDRRDRVVLLVQNRRNSRLVNVPVDFSGNGSVGSLTVSGMVSTRSQASVSRNATLTIRLLDITFNHWQHVPVQTVNLQVPRNWPTNYQLTVQADRITPGHQYAVEADVTDRGRIVLETSTPVPLAGNRRVDLLLVAASGRPGLSDASFEEQIKQWYQQYLGRFPTPRETQAWKADFDRGSSMDDIQAGILSSSEYYDGHKNDRDSYVRDVFSKLSGKDPTTEQQRDLKKRLEQQNDVRLRFTQDLLRQLKESGSGTPGRDR